MRHVAPLAALAGLVVLVLTGCSAGRRPVEQTSITQIRDQQAILLSPELPVGMGQSLAPGMSSLSAVAGLTGAQAPTGDVGQQAIPIHGGLRGASGVGNGVEITASGSIGSPSIDPGPFAAAIDSPQGVLGRGAIGMRTFVPTPSAVEIGFSFDLGAEASTHKQTDTTIVAYRDRSGTTENRSSNDSYDLRVQPHLRSAMILRAPLPGTLPISLIGGFQAQTWTVYWAQRTANQTCTAYSNGDTECLSSGHIPDRPSKRVAVWTPTVGTSIATDVATIHLQGFVHMGPDGVDAVPWGGMVSVELFGGQPTTSKNQVAQR